MIFIARGPEPDDLPLIRLAKIAALRALGREPASDDINGYRVIAENLWNAQHYKCCYCENKIYLSYNDVDHYRPKARADRSPGCVLKHGYWWLAFTWENLLVACSLCNRTNKNDKFPLSVGSTSLVAESVAPGLEIPLLLDPAASINPVEHIVFIEASLGPLNSPKQWWARPRGGSVLGNFTIEVCGLNHPEKRSLRTDHFKNVISKHVRDIHKEIQKADHVGIVREFERALELLSPENRYVALNYDALRALVSEDQLVASINRRWPLPSQIGL